MKDTLINIKYGYFISDIAQRTIFTGMKRKVYSDGQQFNKYQQNNKPPPT